VPSHKPRTKKTTVEPRIQIEEVLQREKNGKKRSQVPEPSAEKKKEKILPGKNARASAKRKKNKDAGRKASLKASQVKKKTEYSNKLQKIELTEGSNDTPGWKSP